MLPSGNAGAGAHSRDQRFVLGPDAVFVNDDHHSPTGHGTREPHSTGPGGPHHPIGADCQVDAAVPSRVRAGWRLERA
jgi:hypothetical protein